MALLLLFVALAGTSQVATTIKVTFDGDTVIVTAQPPEGRTVKSIAVRRASEKKLRAPRDTEPTGKMACYIVKPFLGDVLPVKPLPSPPH